MLQNQTKHDHLGIGVSVLCALHCAAVPILSSAALGLTSAAKWLHHPIVEVAIILIVLVIGFQAFPKAYKRHRDIFPSIVFFLGLAIFGIPHLLHLHDIETFCSIIGGILIAVSHFLNIRADHRRVFSNSQS